MSSEVRGSHLMGADMTYEQTGPYKYKLICKFYRECAGITLLNPYFKVYCNLDTQGYSFTCTRSSIKDISLKCDSDSFPCYPQNSPGLSGVEEHVYETELDFTKGNYLNLKNLGACKMIVSAEICCRNGAITTLSPGNFYSELMIDICLGAKKASNGVRFTSPPIQYVCCNIPINYNNGISADLDRFDSLSFSSDDPKRSLNMYEAYNNPFSKDQPMTTNGINGYIFNESNGSFYLTPIACSQVGVIVIKCERWRKDSSGTMQLLSVQRREMELIVKNCGNDNNTPYITGMSNFAVCEGNKLCFTINSKDDLFLPNQTIRDTTQLFYDNAIKDASFNIIDSTAAEKSAEFCWQTKVGDSRVTPYFFNVIVKDNHCGDPRIATYGSAITVKPKAKSRRIYTKMFKGKLLMESLADSSTGKNFIYNFTIKDSSGQGASLFTSLKSKDTFTFTQAGKYIIEHTINSPPGNCPAIYRDTFIVTTEHLLDVQNLVYKGELNLFPNPGKGQFKLSTAQNDSEEGSIYIYSLNGQLMRTYKANADSFDVSDLKSGSFIVELRTNDSVYFTTLIIE
ncbi:MAG TPA: T9SS type A sorting domain-containing protein [Bacteroidia bacterium]